MQERKDGQPQEPLPGHVAWDQMTPDARRHFIERVLEMYRGEPSNPHRFGGRNIEDLATSSYARLPEDLQREIERDYEPFVGPDNEERTAHAHKLQHPEEYMPRSENTSSPSEPAPPDEPGEKAA